MSAEGRHFLTRLGILPGAADILVFHRRDGRAMRIIFFEVKSDIGAQSKKQKDFEAHVREMGLEYFLIRSAGEMKKIISTN